MSLNDPVITWFTSSWSEPHWEIPPLGLGYTLPLVWRVEITHDGRYRGCELVSVHRGEQKYCGRELY